MSYETPLLKELPEVVSLEDRARWNDAKSMAPIQRVKLLESMIEEYYTAASLHAHPYLLVQLGHNLILVGSGMIAVGLLRKAQDILARMGITDAALDKTIVEQYDVFDQRTREVLELSDESSSANRLWKPTREHKFPITFPVLPTNAEFIKAQWDARKEEEKVSLFSIYLNQLALDTNQLDGVFLVDDESAINIVQRGIPEGKIDVLPGSEVKDTETIRAAMQDIISAYDLLLPLADNPQNLTPSAVCKIHARIMNTCRYIGNQYTPPGRTRKETQKTVAVMSGYNLECCPFPEVDRELEYICNMSKQWIRTWRNPFATASWVYLIFTDCQPFDAGNGRVARLLASIPLIKYGYPPISIGVHQSIECSNGLRKARTGNHTALINLIVEGIQETLEFAQDTIDSGRST